MWNRVFEASQQRTWNPRPQRTTGLSTRWSRVRYRLGELRRSASSRGGPIRLHGGSIPAVADARDSGPGGEVSARSRSDPALSRLTPRRGPVRRTHPIWPRFGPNSQTLTLARHVRFTRASEPTPACGSSTRRCTRRERPLTGLHAAGRLVAGAHTPTGLLESGE